MHRIIQISELISSGKSVLLLGPRGVGKTYLVNNLSYGKIS
jgi:predicted AAA+ superfamily ATPase